MKTHSLKTLGLFLVTTLLLGAAPADDAISIITKSTELMRFEGSESIATLTIVNQRGQKRVRKIATVSKLFDDGKTEKRLIRFIAPADIKGTGLLTWDYEDKSDDMWLFMPALRKTRRIVASDKAKSFMGSEFSYSDITPPAIADFKYVLKPEETIVGVVCWVIEYTPKTEDIAEENGFSKRKVWLGKEDYVPRKAQYWDLSGELKKTFTVLEIKEVDTVKHRSRMMHMKMINEQNGRSSEMKTDKFQLRSDFPDDYFTTRYLERN